MKFKILASAGIAAVFSSAATMAVRHVIHDPQRLYRQAVEECMKPNSVTAQQRFDGERLYQLEAVDIYVFVYDAKTDKIIRHSAVMGEKDEPLDVGDPPLPPDLEATMQNLKACIAKVSPPVK